MHRLLLLVCVWLFGVTSYAHEGRPVYVEVAQTSETEYHLQWKIPPVMATGMEPLIRLEGEDCEPTTGNIRRSLSGALRYQCDDAQAALEVVLSYPDANPVLSTLLLFRDLNNAEQQSFSGPDVARIAVGQPTSLFLVSKQYLSAGVKHFLMGFDHLLFVLCLMFIAGTPRRLLFTITGFTLGHSITLGLASYGYVRVPSVFVEVLIALSIVILAAEIIKNNRTTLAWRHPVAVAALFGLLHGFGFASVLTDLGLSREMMIVAFAFFNIGLELGQLFFVANCWLVYRLFLAQTPAFKTRQAAYSLLTMYTIGTLSAYWAVDRYFGLL